MRLQGVVLSYGEHRGNFTFTIPKINSGFLYLREGKIHDFKCVTSFVSCSSLHAVCSLASYFSIVYVINGRHFSPQGGMDEGGGPDYLDAS